MSDVNLEVAGVLLDMAALAGDSQRGWGYKRAAKAVLRLDRHITPLIHANRRAECGVQGTVSDVQGDRSQYLKWARGPGNADH